MEGTRPAAAVSRTQMASYLVNNCLQAAHQPAHHPNDPGCFSVMVAVLQRQIGGHKAEIK